MNNRILILDDFEEQIKLLTQILQNANYQVITTSREEELLDLIERKYPDLILISASLVNKNKDVYLICKKVKLLELGEEIPVIFMNSQVASLEPDKIFKVGASDYLNYPFSSAEILARISHQIQLKTLKQQLKEKTNQLQKLIVYYQKLKVTLEKAQANLDNLIQKSYTQDNSTDEKTFRTTVEKEWLRASRQRAMSGDVADTNISLIMAQLNDFSSYEDNHGTQVVENSLNLVSENISSLIKRSGDLVTQLQGGKFAILLPNTDAAGAQTVAEKIQHQIESLSIPHDYSEFSEYLNFSIGIASAIPTQGLPPDIFIEKAEKALEKVLETKANNLIEIDYV
jgi:diguanylate cyclase (GGDEF)-like protein